MLYVTVFIAGGALMALEMLGSRILAPYYGSSIMVWGSIIGIILAALSGGYYAGGRMADRRPTVGPLAQALVAAGLWTWVLPILADVLLPWLAKVLPGPRSGPLLASILLFAGPSVLLAMVTPWATRLAARSVETMGAVAGQLSAVSTVGSITGTMLTAFYLIPVLGVASLVRGLGISVLAVGVVISMRDERFRRTAIGLASLALLLIYTAVLPGPRTVTRTGESQHFPQETRQASADSAVGPIAGSTSNGVIYQKDSQYHLIRVRNENGIRYLHFDNSWQSGMDLSDPLRSVFEYTDYLLLPMAMRPNSQQVLLVGLGGGTVVKRLLAYQPHVQLDVAELDPAVIDVARTYFGVPKHPRLLITVEDGRRFLQRGEGTYDVVLLDAYYADAIPFHLTTVEFYELLRSRMAPDGLVAANVIGSLEGPRSALLRSMVKTMGTIFPNVYLFPVRGRTAGFQNVIIIGSTLKERVSPEAIIAAAREAGAVLEAPYLEQYASHLLRTNLSVRDVPLLTDDHAPTDNLLYLYR